MILVEAFLLISVNLELAEELVPVALSHILQALQRCHVAVHAMWLFMPCGCSRTV